MMPVAFTRKTDATSEPITKAQAKLQFRHALASGDTTEDSLIDSYITTARAMVEERTGRSLSTQTWQLSIPDWPQALWLPRAVPLASVTHVKYYDAANDLQTLSSSVYTVPSFHEPAVVLLADAQVWPVVYAREDAILVEYITGAADVADIPAQLVQAVYLLVAYWYDNRSAVRTGTMSKEIELGVDALCAPYVRRWPEPVAA
jgi:uncharacterized phiE125 gp8 family phage protein